MNSLLLFIKGFMDIRDKKKECLYFEIKSRLRAVSLFSVVRRAKRETRKWPRA